MAESVLTATPGKWSILTGRLIFRSQLWVGVNLSEVNNGPHEFQESGDTGDALKVVISLGQRYLWVDKYRVP